MKIAYTMQIYKGKRGGWFLRIIARNGKIVMDGGEAYKNAYNARRAAARFAYAFASDNVAITQI